MREGNRKLGYRFQGIQHFSKRKKCFDNGIIISHSIDEDTSSREDYKCLLGDSKEVDEDQSG